MQVQSANGHGRIQRAGDSARTLANILSCREALEKAQLMARSGVIAPRVLDAMPNRQPYDEVQDHHRDDPKEQEDRFEPRDVHAWTIKAGRARRPDLPH